VLPLLTHLLLFSNYSGLIDATGAIIASLQYLVENSAVSTR
jgi:hypothetical protein